MLGAQLKGFLPSWYNCQSGLNEAAGPGWADCPVTCHPPAILGARDPCLSGPLVAPGRMQGVSWALGLLPLTSERQRVIPKGGQRVK